MKLLYTCLDGLAKKFPECKAIGVISDSTNDLLMQTTINYDADRKLAKDLKDSPWYVRKLFGCARFLTSSAYVRSVSPPRKSAPKSSGIIDPFTDSDGE